MVYGKRETVKRAAAAFRIGIEKVKDSLSFGLMKRFPNGCSKTASLLLARYLVQELGASPVTFVSATGRDEKDGLVTHLWLEFSGIIVDITADQFRDIQQAVIVTTDRSWHDRTFPEQESYDFATEERTFDDYYKIKFDSDYNKICEAMLN